jgi:bacteriocin-like protein
MAEIKLSELRPAGSDLLQDSESFLNELNDRELENVVGGNTIASVASQASASVGSILSVTDVGISQTFVTF